MIHSFLLIGQSNMAGRGFLNEAIPVDKSRIYTLRMGRWQKMFRPINPDRSFSGVNLAESFAESYARKHDVDVGLICCADGGTTIDQWMPGTLLYDNAVYNARLAQRTSTVAGILWHQGESDCTNDRYPVYKENLLKMLRQLRADLGLEEVPILIGGLGDYLTQCPRIEWQFRQYYALINESLRSVAAELPLGGFVSAEGLTSNPDYLHFNARSLHEFGLRYFDEYEKLCPNGIPSDSIKSDTRRTAMEQL